MNISVFVAGIPKGQPRPRAFARGGHARVYDPGTAEGWKAQVAMALKSQLPEHPIEIPVMLDLLFYMPRPQSHLKKSGELSSRAPLFPTGKPDLDNLAKAVMDAMTQIGVWNDDSLVIRLVLAKLYCRSESDRPGCVIHLWEAA